jgi:hypothetical protein
MLPEISITGRSALVHGVGDRLRHRFHRLRSLLGGALFRQEVRCDDPLCRLDVRTTRAWSSAVKPPAASCSLMSSMSSRQWRRICS